jgi:2-iminobutanoate/2-iminopropanoate deaminase
MPAHTLIQDSSLPTPVGPYSPATVYERLVFVSGQAGTDPISKQVAGPDVESQTEQCFKNLRAILRAAGSDLQHVLRCGVFLVDLTEFSKMNAVYERMFEGHKPARTTVEVSALPGPGLRVEIDCVAYLPGTEVD